MQGVAAGAAGGVGVSALTALLAVFTWSRLEDGGHPVTLADRSLAVAPSADAGIRLGDSRASRADDCRGAEDLLRDFHGIHGTAGTDKRQLRHLVVLVPDPAEAGSPDLFDLVREGVEEAVTGRPERPHGPTPEDWDYVKDRQWLPAAPGGWNDCPGLALFRPVDGASSEMPPLMVMYVGETQGHGLRVAAFERAMQLVDEHGAVHWEVVDTAPQPDLGPRKAELKRRVNVLGPTFSGTAASLSATIHRHRAGRRFVVVSATVTSPRVPSIMVREARPRTTVCARPRAQNEDVRFEAIAADDACLLSSMEKFLTARGGRCGTSTDSSNMVVFTEASTYGAIDRDAGPPGEDETGSCLVRWKLPPKLTAVGTTAGAGATAAPAGRHAAALASTLDLLSRRGIRFVGLMLTDPQDVVSLARRIRERHPDIRLFTLGTSSAYQDDDVADVLNGMLVVDSIPRHRRNTMSLQNEMVRKVYFAGRQLLFDESREKPDIRFSFVGNGRIWKLLDLEEREPDRYRRTPAAWKLVLALFLTLYVLLLGIVFWGLRRQPWPRPRTGLWALVAPCWFPDLRARDGVVSALLLLVAGAPPVLMWESMLASDHWLGCLGLSTAIFVPPVLVCLRLWIIGGGRRDLRPTHHVQVRTDLGPLRPCGLDVLPAGVTLALIVLVLYVGCGPERTATFHLLSGGSPVLVALIAMVSFGVMLWCARVRLRLLDGHRSFGRSGSFLRARPPIATALGEAVPDGSGTGSRLAKAEKALMDGLLRPSSGWFAMMVVHGALMGTMIGALLLRPVHTLESGARHLALVGLGLVAALPASLNLAWFLTTWYRLLRLLRCLAPTAAARALGGLERHRRPSLSRLLAWTGGQSAERDSALDALRQLLAADPQAGESDPRMRRRSTWSVADTSDGPVLQPAPEGRDAGRLPVGLEEFLVDASGQLMRERTHLAASSARRVDALAARLLDLILPRYVCQLRLFAPPMLLGCLCCIFLTSLYFAHPQRLIAMTAFCWVAVTVTVALASYISLDLDPVISAMAGSSAGRIGWLGLGRKVIAWGSVPIASYLAVEHPQFSLWVSDFLDLVGKSFR